MLGLRPNCECCNQDLPPESLDTRICSFECTFCVACADEPLAGKLANAPASTGRIVEPGGCATMESSLPAHD